MRHQESAPSRARRMLEQGCSVEGVRKATGLPEDTIRRIAAPIQAIQQAERTVRNAELRIGREMRREENKRLRAIQPCPLCATGHAEPNSYTLMADIIDQQGDRVGVVADVNFCQCSNPRCVARLMYPRDTPQEAVRAFMEGRFAEPHPFVDSRTGMRIMRSRAGVQSDIQRLLGRWDADEVKRLGFDPRLVDRLAMEYTLDRVKNDPDELSTELMCPNCGHKGEYRKAVNPVTHRKDAGCWWRVACRHCGLRLAHAFPTQEDARIRFENGDVEAEPTIMRKEGKSC